MLIYTYEVSVPDRRYAMPFSFKSREEADKFRTGLEENFKPLRPRVTEGPIYYVASALESLAVFEREINEKS